IIDNGPGRGSRIAWINTGSGLRYKVLVDRAMDISDAFYNRHGLAWLSHLGVTPPEPFSGTGMGWLRTFGGGLLTTCGLSHVGGPETDQYGERGLHGFISNTPAEIESVIQPDPAAGKLEMSITGTVKESRPFGPCLELKRTISGTVGRASIRIRDKVSNRGNTPAPHMLLYHCNFGWPLVDEGADIVWKGGWQPREKGGARIFREGNTFRKCPAPMEEHSGTGEEAAFIDIEPDAAGRCTCGLYNSRLGIALALKFSKAQLPWLINWQHWGRGEYVTGLEPATNPPIGQAAARQRNELIQLAPGESREYDLEIELLDKEEEINEFLNNKI
ncbi:MAG TPA: aldose 1-epimerase family protein, partial [Anseongella sp.]|nr:aldose 1-epimerase family protein [Anseongella sp.]